MFNIGFPPELTEMYKWFDLPESQPGLQGHTCKLSGWSDMQQDVLTRANRLLTLLSWTVICYTFRQTPTYLTRTPLAAQTTLFPKVTSAGASPISQSHREDGKHPAMALFSLFN